MTIEEAFRALAQEAQDIHEGPMVFPPATPETFTEAARDLAMTVLEEALGGLACWSSACGSVQESPEAIQRYGKIYHCKPCRFRTRIAALGT